MDWMRRLFGRQTPQPPVSQQQREEAENILPDWFTSIDWRRWDAPLNLTIGESRRNDAIAALAGAPRRQGYLIPVTATLVRDSDNPMDRNAIKVEIHAVHVGYIRREVAFHLAPIFDSDHTRKWEVAAIIRGGSLNAPNFGVHLWLDKTLSPAPCIRLQGVDHLRVAWPPWEDEGIE